MAIVLYEVKSLQNFDKKNGERTLEGSSFVEITSSSLSHFAVDAIRSILQVTSTLFNGAPVGFSTVQANQVHHLSSIGILLTSYSIEKSPELVIYQSGKMEIIRSPQWLEKPIASPVPRLFYGHPIRIKNELAGVLSCFDNITPYFDQRKLSTFRNLAIALEMILNINEDQMKTKAEVAGLSSQLARLNEYASDLQGEKRSFSESERQMVQQNTELKTLAETDGLTGLLNKRNLMEMAEQKVRSGAKFCILMIDVDNFKAFNDTFGHLPGDVVLKQVARIIDSATPKGSVAARFGGEEITVLLNSEEPESGIQLAEEIRQRIEAFDWKLRQITVSIGVSTNINTSFNTETLFKQADDALYAAKRDGKNRVLGWTV